MPAAKQAEVARDESQQSWAAVGAVLTESELRALGALLAACAEELPGGTSTEHRLVASALAKLLDMPTGLTCCYHERAAIVKLLNEQLLDDSQPPRRENRFDAVREMGYVAGWNDRSRSLRKGLLK